MTRLPAAPARVNPRPGFTLIEMLVSMSVLALIIVFVAQLINSASTTISDHNRHVDADGQAREIFSRLGEDFAHMVRRPDVDYSTFKQPKTPATAAPMPSPSVAPNLQTGGNDRFAFYAETAGSAMGVTASSFGMSARHTVSVVAYQMADDPDLNVQADQSGRYTCLRRMSKALGWEPPKGGASATAWSDLVFLPVTLAGRFPGLFASDPTALAPPATPDPDYATAGDTVFRLEYEYLLKPDLTRPTSPQAARLSLVPYFGTTPQHSAVYGFRDVAAIVVTIAILDPASRAIVTETNDLSRALPDATEGDDTKAAWTAIINNPHFTALARIPPRAAAGVRVYERYFYLPNNP